MPINSHNNPTYCTVLLIFVYLIKSQFHGYVNSRPMILSSNLLLNILVALQYLFHLNFQISLIKEIHENWYQYFKSFCLQVQKLSKNIWLTGCFVNYITRIWKNITKYSLSFSSHNLIILSLSLSQIVYCFALKISRNLSR